MLVVFEGRAPVKTRFPNQSRRAAIHYPPHCLGGTLSILHPPRDTWRGWNGFLSDWFNSK